ncbi:hypothetical protein [Wenyingzhuangia sp. 2_MG-2023]|uniref:hypothetical protein n=1 Tax=Wenyingzhuangia sp. 2_MG-2023 TaxID=3062639 RepID=UPI0026E34778|nr:hypothetical protein [Wenyingzhuangia sp. 2_MG-2023]MDO6738217.1 hypothetical protein [Wenyingzhuangia sp. 2_MG-2023]
MKKTILFLTAMIFSVMSSFSQNTWYNTGSGEIHLEPFNFHGASYTPEHVNPKTTGIYTEKTASKYVRYGSEGKNADMSRNGSTVRFKTFKVAVPKSKIVGENADLTVKLKLYVPNFENIPSNSISLILRTKNKTNTQLQVTKVIPSTTANDWQEIEFDFTNAQTSPDGYADSYNSLVIVLTSRNKPTEDFEYYLDDITANFDITKSNKK